MADLLDESEPTVIPDPQAYDRPGDVPTETVSQERVDFGKGTLDADR